MKNTWRHSKKLYMPFSQLFNIFWVIFQHSSILNFSFMTLKLGYLNLLCDGLCYHINIIRIWLYINFNPSEIQMKFYRIKKRHCQMKGFYSSWNQIHFHFSNRTRTCSKDKEKTGVFFSFLINLLAFNDKNLKQQIVMLNLFVWLKYPFIQILCVYMNEVVKPMHNLKRQKFRIYDVYDSILWFKTYQIYA